MLSVKRCTACANNGSKYSINIQGANVLMISKYRFKYRKYNGVCTHIYNIIYGDMINERFLDPEISSVDLKVAPFSCLVVKTASSTCLKLSIMSYVT